MILVQLTAVLLLLLVMWPSCHGWFCRPGYVQGYFPTCFKGGFCIVRGDICINGECCRPQNIRGCPIGTWPNGRCRNTANCRNSCLNDICCRNVDNFCDFCVEGATHCLQQRHVLYNKGESKNNGKAHHHLRAS